MQTLIQKLREVKEAKNALAKFMSMRDFVSVLTGSISNAEKVHTKYASISMLKILLISRGLTSPGHGNLCTG